MNASFVALPCRKLGGKAGRSLHRRERSLSRALTRAKNSPANAGRGQTFVPHRDISSSAPENISGAPRLAVAGEHASSPTIGGRRTKLLTIVMLAMSALSTDNPQSSPASPILSAGVPSGSARHSRLCRWNAVDGPIISSRVIICSIEKLVECTETPVGVSETEEIPRLQCPLDQRAGCSQLTGGTARVSTDCAITCCAYSLGLTPQ
jgi:hypothetical protein